MFWRKGKISEATESIGKSDISVETNRMCKAAEDVAVNTVREDAENNRPGVHYDDRTANEKGFFFRINGQICKITNYKGTDTYVRIPDTINGKPVKEIRTRAFAGKQIQRVVLPTELRRIGQEAFMGCALEMVELPEKIVRIEDRAFADCINLKQVCLRPEGKKNFDVCREAFSGTPFITAESFVILGEMLLCINLTENMGELYIPRSVKYIKKGAAQYAKHKWGVDWVSKIVIPESVQRIEDEAFAILSNISSVQVESVKKYHYVHLGRDVFGSMAGHSPFKMRLIQEKLGQNSMYLVGWKEFRELEIGESDWGSNVGKCRIFIPESKHWEFLKCLQIRFFGGNDFRIRMESKDYFELMLQVRSFQEKMEMAKFFTYRSYGRNLGEKIKEFLGKYEGRARKYAVRKRDNELLQLYQRYGFWKDIVKF